MKSAPTPRFKIHIFNPEVEYDLASFRQVYTPPAKVVELRRRLALTPARFAGPCDVILLLDPPIEGRAANETTFHEDSQRETGENRDFFSKNIRIVMPSETVSFFNEIRRGYFLDYKIQPWGWTPALKHKLTMYGCPEELLPEDSELIIIRRLAHRSTAISFNRVLNRNLGARGFNPKHLSPLPVEFCSTAGALEWLDKNPDAYLKLPLSSSGRGVISTGSIFRKESIREWIDGGIRHQGSVMAETAFPRSLDFATEWEIKDGQPEFLGVSVFMTNPRGRYMGNYTTSQSNLMNIIHKTAPDFNDDFITCQREALKEIAEGYSGFAGIDMMADPNGAIRGGVELNFRMTMGIAALLENRLRSLK